MNTLLYLGIALVIAYATKWLVEKINIPNVTGYVIVGVLTGTSLLKLFGQDVLDQFSVISDFALAIIAFSIGVELKKENLSKIGLSILVIALFESIFAFTFVFLVTYSFNPSSIHLALLLGAVASATAPAATVYVIKQYRAKGPLTSTILGVVGIDDAFALIIYVFASLYAEAFLRHSGISLSTIIFTPLYRVVLSMIIGTAAGVGYTLLFKKIRYSDDLSIGIAASILVVLGISEMLNLSELLSVMTLGVVLVNTDSMLSNRSHRVVESFSPVILPLFFIFAGAHLNIFLIGKVGLLGILYTVARFSGKIGGATLGATISRADKKVRKYIGFSLLPQVGIALALSLAIQKQFGRGQFGTEGIETAGTIINLLLFTTIITEIAGPLLTRHSLDRAQELYMKE